jgi:hypothetical protein
MAKVNFRHNKRQKELARKERQSERLSRRGERPPEEALAAPVSSEPVPTGEPVSVPQPTGDTT